MVRSPPSFKLGDRVVITDLYGGRFGRLGSVWVVLPNGAIVQLAGNRFVAVRAAHLEHMYE